MDRAWYVLSPKSHINKYLVHNLQAFMSPLVCRENKNEVMVLDAVLHFKLLYIIGWR